MNLDHFLSASASAPATIHPATRCASFLALFGFALAAVPWLLAASAPGAGPQPAAPAMEGPAAATPAPATPVRPPVRREFAFAADAVIFDARFPFARLDECRRTAPDTFDLTILP
jgi:hypothetical protein